MMPRMKITALAVLLIASTVYEHDRQRAYAAGCDVFLPMPCLPEALLHEVRRFAAGAQLGRLGLGRLLLREVVFGDSLERLVIDPPEKHLAGRLGVRLSGDKA